MRMPIHTCRRIRLWFTVALAAAFLSAAPAADARPDPNGGAPATDEPAVVVVEPGSGFDWADAAIGAGAAAGIALLGGGMAAGLGHRRRFASS
jgi:hypothetical protein